MDNNLTHLENSFKKYIKNITHWLPEGVIDVDINLLQRFNLLNYHSREKQDPALTRYFHVVESPEKITLVNEQFVVWIVPEKIGDVPVTYTLIALNHSDQPQLELAFSTSGVYNSSRLVLRVLEKFLFEIQENEDILTGLKKVS